MPLLNINPKPIVDSDTLYLSGSVAASASGQVLDNATYPAGGFFPAQFRTRTGKQAYITFLGNNVSAGGAAYATFHLLLDGVRSHSQAGKAFGSFPNQLADPARPSDGLPVRIPVGQNQLIQITADNSDAANAYTFSVRLEIQYEDF